MTDPRFDVEALRLERLARLQAAMGAHGVDVCLLFHEPNIRYATGASAMPEYAMSTFVRCAVVPQEGTPILFEHASSMHRSALRAPDARVGVLRRPLSRRRRRGPRRPWLRSASSVGPATAWRSIGWACPHSWRSRASG